MSADTKRMQILWEVAFEADRFYAEVQALGETASRALSSGKRAQITNLQNLANSTLKVSDVLDYIKTQTARDADRKDAKHGWHQQAFGLTLLEFIEQGTLHQKKQGICTKLSLVEESTDGQEVYLLLIREAMKQLAAQYEFANFKAGRIGDDD